MQQTGTVGDYYYRVQGLFSGAKHFLCEMSKAFIPPPEEGDKMGTGTHTTGKLPKNKDTSAQENFQANLELIDSHPG